MVKYEICAQFIGEMLVNIEANSSEEAKEKFLIQMETIRNPQNEPIAMLSNVVLPTKIPIKINELNICFSEKLAETVHYNLLGINIEDLED